MAKKKKAKAKAKKKKVAGNLNITKGNLGSKYGITSQAKDAVANLTSALGLSNKLDTSNPFGFITDDQRILDALNEAAIAAYDQQAREEMQNYNRAEDTLYRNTQDTVNEMRRNMVGSASAGANVGAANATALQAILGLGRENAAATTEALQGVQNVAGQKAAALAENASNAITQSNEAKAQQAQVSTEKYAADMNRAAYAAEALGSLAGAVDTNKSNEQMNQATNLTNQKVAQTTQKSETKSKNTNINK